MPRKRPSALVSWSQVATAQGYKVYWGTRSHAYPYYQDVGSSLQYRVGNLQRNFTYYFAVKSYNASGESQNFSPEATWTT